MELKYVLKDCSPMTRRTFQKAIRYSKTSLGEFLDYVGTDGHYWVNSVYIMVGSKTTDNVIHLFKCREILDYVISAGIEAKDDSKTQ